MTVDELHAHEVREVAHLKRELAVARAQNDGWYGFAVKVAGYLQCSAASSPDANEHILEKLAALVASTTAAEVEMEKHDPAGMGWDVVRVFAAALAALLFTGVVIGAAVYWAWSQETIVRNVVLASAALVCVCLVLSASWMWRQFWSGGKQHHEAAEEVPLYSGDREQGPLEAAIIDRVACVGGFFIAQVLRLLDFVGRIIFRPHI